MKSMKIYIKYWNCELTRGSSANECPTSAIKALAGKPAPLLKMSCNSGNGFKTSYLLCLSLLLLCIFMQLNVTSGYSVDYSTTTMMPDNMTVNATDDDLYVIKAVVYEIGILTDADNSTDNTTERQEVKLSFYNSPGDSNGP